MFSVTLMEDEANNDWRTVQRRFKSLQTHILSPRFTAWLVIVDSRSSPMRLYLLAATANDTPTTAKQMSQELQRLLIPYGFDLRAVTALHNRLPIISHFVRRYTAAAHRRAPDHKRARIIRYSQGWRPVTAQFAWNTTGGWLWRAKLARFAQAIGARRCNDLTQLCGARWAYHFGNAIMAIELTDYPTMDHAIKDDWMPVNEKDPDVRQIPINGNRVSMKQSPNTPPKLPVQIVAQVALRNFKK